MKIALTVAGSDSGGCAGIQADLKTFAALGVHGASVITALTAQNTCEVADVYDLPASFVKAQFDAVLRDIGADAVKTGMLSRPEIIEAVADRFRAYRLERYVLDPVMAATTGGRLLAPDALEPMKRLLAPLALIITPNTDEAAALAGFPVTDLKSMREAARAIRALGPRCVVVKGGQLSGEATDIVYDGDQFVYLRARRIPLPETHGFGCAFSAAITAELARGAGPIEAVRRAKRFIGRELRASIRLGDKAVPAPLGKERKKGARS